ncbi:endonuclease/exonuclease/phosphatase family protein [Actibacterium sp. XHP0104]|uniref:endonuclease/exonuclease/phosphatase family protein n=1 Tax=Actibacterium sp. XHP0104 TaxID=2984335 RepID=UPI002981EC19|nr:endonuclease/exonuclease/phosphatase family protein [Actibacterium sp. XHP0104]
MATYNTELSRNGPGALIHDIQSGDDAQVQAVIAIIAHAAPDVVLLQGIDHDAAGAALDALAEGLARAGHPYPHRLALRPNSGLRTGLDHDGDGRSDGPRDAQGYGEFTGQGGMALLSRHPLGEVRDFSGLLWADLPGATLPRVGGQLFPDAALYQHQRLSNVAHWDVPVLVGDRALHMLAFHATPPVFDGPEDRNGLRNRDELRLWQLYLDGALGAEPPGDFVIVGDANIDPADGDGLSDAIQQLLADPRITDPRPQGVGSVGAANADHHGDPALDTADFDDPAPGNLRVDYVLPAARLPVAAAGVVWPAPDDPLSDTARMASRHHLVWVDLVLDR